MAKSLLHNALLINEGKSFHGYILIDDTEIAVIGNGLPPQEITECCDYVEDLDGKWILPGIIDDQVHFRDPGMTWKGNIATESRAAIAGGVTSFMDMPNTKPQTVTAEAWKDKMEHASDVSWANYAFFFGATNDNAEEITKLDRSLVPGLKVFLGSSTGNMLVDDEQALDAIFSLPWLIAVHSEDESIIRANAAGFRERYGDNVPVSAHPLIRSSRACYECTARAIERARRLGTKLHILHLSTAEEASMLSDEHLGKRKITGEVCVHHLWFTDADYDRLGALIKWNPAVKRASDRAELRRAISDGRIQIVATDHAPHLPEEKEGGALNAASGGPGVQYSLLIMLELALQGVVDVTKVVELMCHNPAILFRIDRRGFLRQGYHADLVVVDPKKSTVAGEQIFSRCGWTPYQGIRFSHYVDSTYVNGQRAYHMGTFESRNPQPLLFSTDNKQ